MLNKFRKRIIFERYKKLVEERKIYIRHSNKLIEELQNYMSPKIKEKKMIQIINNINDHDLIEFKNAGNVLFNNGICMIEKGISQRILSVDNQDNWRWTDFYYRTDESSKRNNDKYYEHQSRFSAVKWALSEGYRVYVFSNKRELKDAIKHN